MVAAEPALADVFAGIREALDGDLKNIKAYVVKEGKTQEISLYVADITADERKIVKAGCLIDYNRFRGN